MKREPAIRRPGLDQWQSGKGRNASRHAGRMKPHRQSTRMFSATTLTGGKRWKCAAPGIRPGYGKPWAQAIRRARPSTTSRRARPRPGVARVDRRRTSALQPPESRGAPPRRSARGSERRSRPRPAADRHAQVAAAVGEVHRAARTGHAHTEAHRCRRPRGRCVARLASVPQRPVGTQPRLPTRRQRRPGRAAVGAHHQVAPQRRRPPAPAPIKVRSTNAFRG